MSSASYPRPPIQEAILDVFVTLPEGVDLDKMAEFGEHVATQFPERKPRHSVQGNFRINMEDASQNTARSVVKHSGFIFRNPAKDRAVQARLDGFTFNRMPTYAGWAEFSTEARALWELYVKIVSPALISKIGLRYVNRINLPIDLSSFRDYCPLFPDSAVMISPISNFLLSYAAPCAGGATAEITVAIPPPPLNKSAVPLLLDVNLVQEVEAPLTKVDFWPMFENLRTQKNLLFEASITDKARALFHK